MTEIVVRPHVPDDDEVCAWLWQRASQTMRRDHGLPWREPSQDVVAILHRRFAHVRSTDPSGCVVAEADGEVVGLAHALVRDGLWICSLFGVEPRWQSRGIGKRMLDVILEYGDPSRGLIAASADARAVHRYERAGFRPMPTVSAVGAVGRLAPTTDVREGSIDDLSWIPDVDRAVRGASREVDIRYYVDAGSPLLVVPRVGYAVVDRRPVFLAATHEDAARQLLFAALSVSDGPEVEVSWLTEHQRWARELLAELGFGLRRGGSIMVRGEPGPLVPWLPHGGFC